MYEELIKALKNCGYPGCGHYCSNGCVMSPDGTATCEQTPLLRKAANVIEELSAKYEKALRDLVKQVELPKWIPVTERLPKADERDSRGFAVPYLVMNGWRRVTARYEDGLWVLFGEGLVLKYVTHWMELPEPPKEGE